MAWIGRWACDRGPQVRGWPAVRPADELAGRLASWPSAFRQFPFEKVGIRAIAILKWGKLTRFFENLFLMHSYNLRS